LSTGASFNIRPVNGDEAGCGVNWWSLLIWINSISTAIFAGLRAVAIAAKSSTYDTLLPLTG
jgi:hypothetical protein